MYQGGIQENKPQWTTNPRPNRPRINPIEELTQTKLRTNQKPTKGKLEANPELKKKSRPTGQK